jgi:hypothetical protein
MFKPHFWIVTGVGAFALHAWFNAAEAQQTSAGALPASTTTAAPKEADRIVTPRKSRVGAAARAAAPQKSDGEPNWEEVNQAISETKARDAEFQRQVRAMELTRQVSPAEQEKLRPKGLRQGSMREFKRMESKEVQETRVPVLAPRHPDLMGTMRIAGRKNAFTAFADLPDGAFVEIIGTRMRVVGGDAESLAMRKAARGDADMPRLEAMNAPYTISHHEQGVDLSFSRFNVAYQIAVYCAAPDADERCAEDAYVTSLADSLAIMNPEAGAPQ